MFMVRSFFALLLATQLCFIKNKCLTWPVLQGRETCDTCYTYKHMYKITDTLSICETLLGLTLLTSSAIHKHFLAQFRFSLAGFLSL